MTARIEKAFILAAGLGKRLLPLTRVLPKPLLPVVGRPILGFALEHLQQLGTRRFALNAHHLLPAFHAALPGLLAPGSDLQIFHEPELLETGGALVNARDWFDDDPVLVHSGDVVTDIDLGAVVDAHFREKNVATLALRETGLAAQVAFDPATGQVTDLQSALGRRAPVRLDYANVAVINGEILRFYDPGPRLLVAVLLDCLRRGGRLGGVVLNGGGWFNVGSRHEYLTLHRVLLTAAWRPAFTPQPWWAPEEVAGDGRYAVTGATWVAAGAKVGPGAALHDTIVWAKSRVAPGTRLDACVVTGQAVGPGTFFRQDFCA
ncbi:MAG: NTP transferase domain-containing protein [Verrucomicrobia bacterium]|nr:NTP transferase domain-containing protein [Verrucomicrobiota bacterium]